MGSESDLKFADAYGDLCTFCNGIVKTEDGVISQTIDIRVPFTLKEEELRSMCEGKTGRRKWPVLNPERRGIVFNNSPLVTSLYKPYVRCNPEATENKPMVIGGGTYAKSLKKYNSLPVEMPGIDYRDHSADGVYSGRHGESVLIYMEAIKICWLSDESQRKTTVSILGRS